MEPSVANLDIVLVRVGLADLELEPPALEVHVRALERVHGDRGR